MAVAAAVASVCEILEKTLQHQCLILYDGDREEIKSLLREVSFLRDSLSSSNYWSRKSSEMIESLEDKIIDSAHRARDVIQTHIMEQFLEVLSSQYPLVACEINSIYNVIRRIQAECLGGHNPLPLTNWPSPDFIPSGEYVIMLIRLMNDLDGELKTSSIVGMSTTGNTAIARAVYKAFNHPGSGYDICAWSSIATQAHCVRQTVIDLLDSIKIFTKEMHQESNEKLGEYLYTALKGHKYFIVLDNVQDTKVWDDLICLFPNDHNESRILLTTRLHDVAVYTESYSRPHCNDFVRHVKSLQYILLHIGQYAQNLLRGISPLQDVLENQSHKGCKKAKSLRNEMMQVEKKLKNVTEACFTNYKLTFSAKCLTKVKGEINLVKQMVMKTEVAESSTRDLRPRTCSADGAGSFKPTATSVVGFHADFLEIKNQLARESHKLEVISLVGMGGIGKTTLARELGKDKFILEFFLICAWITVSQSYDLKQILIGLLDSMKSLPINHESQSIEDLEERLYKSLKGRRYMIIVDDVWETKIWDDLRQLFPDDMNSSRILLTTRIENVAIYAKSSCLHHMHLLDVNASWNLFCNKVFGDDCCPPELDEIGKKIVKTCGGLPLAIVMVGGLLSRSSRAQHYWRYIAENLCSKTMSNIGCCSEIISLSFSHLPQHLRKCFLYAAIFPEDYSIKISELVKLWIADGILEPLTSNCLEDRAYEYVLDLVDRSLLLADKRSSTGGIKSCRIHDIVRDFCLRMSKKEMLCHISDGSLCFIPIGASVSLLSIYPNPANIFPCDNKKLSSLQVSSLLNFDLDFLYLAYHLNPMPLRVFHVEIWDQIIKLELNDLLSRNLRYFATHHVKYLSAKLSYTACSNLQTLILGYNSMEVPIWNLPKLRHVKVWKLYVSDPSEGKIDVLVLENLQTLSTVVNFRCSIEVLQRIPNLKKLGICYDMEKLDWEYLCLNNLACLHKLEALSCCFNKLEPSFLHVITFPPSLKKLSLEGGGLPWKDMVIVALLPNLEVLKLKLDAFKGQEWGSNEEQFPKLKYLRLQDLDLEQWKANCDQYPSLQCLVISCCQYMKEIPSCFGEIPTLQLLELRYCSDSLVASAKDIEQEQRDLGNDELQVLIQRI